MKKLISKIEKPKILPEKIGVSIEEIIQETKKIFLLKVSKKQKTLWKFKNTVGNHKGRKC